VTTLIAEGLNRVLPHVNGTDGKLISHCTASYLPSIVTGTIFYRLRDIASCWSKIAKQNSYTPPVFSAPCKDDPVSEFCKDAWYP